MHAPEEHDNSPTGEVTRLLRRWTEGDARARDALAAELYGELRRIAGYRMHDERASMPSAASSPRWTIPASRGSSTADRWTTARRTW